MVQRAGRGLDLKEWLTVWSAADDEVIPADMIGAEPVRRQAVVFSLAAEIAQGVYERLRAIGLTALPPALPPAGE